MLTGSRIELSVKPVTEMLPKTISVPGAVPSRLSPGVLTLPGVSVIVTPPPVTVLIGATTVLNVKNSAEA